MPPPPGAQRPESLDLAVSVGTIQDSGDWVSHSTYLVPPLPVGSCKELNAEGIADAVPHGRTEKFYRLLLLGGHRGNRAALRDVEVEAAEPDGARLGPEDFPPPRDGASGVGEEACGKDEADRMLGEDLCSDDEEMIRLLDETLGENEESGSDEGGGSGRDSGADGPGAADAEALEALEVDELGALAIVPAPPPGPAINLQPLRFGSWGVFKITPKQGKAGKFGGFQVACPFHRKNYKSDCHKFIALDGPPDDRVARMRCMRRLLWWCWQTKQQPRQYIHIAMDLPDGNDMDYAFIQANKITEAPARQDVWTDEDLDSLLVPLDLCPPESFQRAQELYDQEVAAGRRAPKGAGRGGRAGGRKGGGRSRGRGSGPHPGPKRGPRGAQRRGAAAAAVPGSSGDPLAAAPADEGDGESSSEASSSKSSSSASSSSSSSSDSNSD